MALPLTDAQLASPHMEDIEAARLQPADATRPEPPHPAHFDNRYTLPVHEEKLLRTRNEHERDKSIQFHEVDHIYTVHDLPVQVSVSGLALDFESKFDSARTIGQMKRSRKQKWPRLQYVVNAREIQHVDQFCGSFGAMIVNGKTGSTLASSMPGVDASGIVLYTVLKDTVQQPQCEEKWYLFDRCMTDEEICHGWELNGEQARNRGTEAHLMMEYWFNSMQVRLGDGEVKVGLDFVRRCLLPIGAVAYRTEWTIYSDRDQEDVAGTIDLAVILPNGDLFLVDWKRSEKLRSKMYGYSQMKPPLDHLEDCSGCAYALQLGCYQYLIEKYYGLRVVGRALASIHPDAPFTTAVPYLRNEVEFLMARRREITRARIRLSSAPEHASLCCTDTGRFLVDAVRDGSGALYEDKVAKLRGIACTPCAATSAEAAAVLHANMEPVRVEPSAPWKVQFPQPSDDLMLYS